MEKNKEHYQIFHKIQSISKIKQFNSMAIKAKKKKRDEKSYPFFTNQVGKSFLKVKTHVGKNVANLAFLSRPV